MTQEKALAESKDEKIRKDCLKYLDWEYHRCSHEEDKIKIEKCIAWLEKQCKPAEINPSEFDSQLNRLLKQFESLPKEELASSLSFYLNVVQNDGTYKEEKQGEQKPAWSEEDKEMLDGIIVDVEVLKEQDRTKDGKAAYQKEIDWLKSLKDRVQPQPKQEWSKEEQQIIEDAACIILDCVNTAETKKEEERLEELADKLQDLRPQNTWKPSQGQLECLGYAIEKAEKDWSPLVTNRIYLTLKALKEQLEKL